MRKVSDDIFYIPYKTENGLEYVKANGHISTLIDFGMSHVQGTEDNRVLHFGRVGRSSMDSFGVYKDKINRVIDCYKFLCFCLKTFKEFNPKIYRKTSCRSDRTVFEFGDC